MHGEPALFCLQSDAIDKSSAGTVHQLLPVDDLNAGLAIFNDDVHVNALAHMALVTGSPFARTILSIWFRRRVVDPIGFLTSAKENLSNFPSRSCAGLSILLALFEITS